METERLEKDQIKTEQIKKEKSSTKGVKESSFEEILEKDGELVYTNKGVSMMPLLRQGKDLFVVTRRDPASRLKKYDVALFHRGNQYVLHRVLKVLPEGYLICGDHCWQKEHVAEAQIMGVMTSFIRNGHETPVTDRRYLAYVHLWCDFYYIRALILMGKAFCRKVVRR